MKFSEYLSSHIFPFFAINHLSISYLKYYLCLYIQIFFNSFEIWEIKAKMILCLFLTDSLRVDFETLNFLSFKFSTIKHFIPFSHFIYHSGTLRWNVFLWSSKRLENFSHAMIHISKLCTVAFRSLYGCAVKTFYGILLYFVLDNLNCTFVLGAFSTAIMQTEVSRFSWQFL